MKYNEFSAGKTKYGKRGKAMLLDKPILGVLDRTPYLGLIEILWGKADCFSLTTPQDMPEEICIQQ